MSLRDWFAGQAAPAILNTIWANDILLKQLGHDEAVFKNVAANAYALADAMLKEREKQ